MSESAFAAAIRPNVYASSTTGVKKSVVSTSPCPPAIRTTAASSPSSRPTTSSALGVVGPVAVSPATTASSSPGGILQAQPPPCAYWVSRIFAGAMVTRSTVAARRERGDPGRSLQEAPMVRVLLAAALLLVGCSGSAGDADGGASTAGVATDSPGAPGFDQALHDELIEMLERDQSGRTGGSDAEGDAARTTRMKEILEQHGWPTFDLVGEDGEDAAWAIVQHADQDPAFQREA